MRHTTARPAAETTKQVSIDFPASTHTSIKIDDANPPHSLEGSNKNRLNHDSNHDLVDFCWTSQIKCQISVTNRYDYPFSKKDKHIYSSLRFEE